MIIGQIINIFHQASFLWLIVDVIIYMLHSQTTLSNMFLVYCSSENISDICRSYTIHYRQCKMSGVYTVWLLLTAQPQICVTASVQPGTYPDTENWKLVSFYLLFTPFIVFFSVAFWSLFANSFSFFFFFVSFWNNSFTDFCCQHSVVLLNGFFVVVALLHIHT